MAVALNNSEFNGVEFREGVTGFLTARPALRAAMKELIAEARRYFPTETLRVSVHRDLDDYTWESLVLEAVCAADIPGGVARMDAFEQEYVDRALPDHGQDLITLVVGN